MICEDCGVSCKKTGGRQRFCPECRVDGNNRLDRARDATRRPSKTKIGEPLNCERCGVLVLRKQAKQFLCGPCLKPYWLEKAASEREAKRIAAGTDLGITFDCKVCGVPVVKTGFKHLYCQNCSVVVTAKNTEKSQTKHREKRRHANKVWRASDRGQEWAADYRSIPKNRVHSNMSRAIRSSITGKGRRTWEILVGYTTEELIKHLERQFLPGMTWANYGDWHIDHIVPKTSFDFSSSEDPEFLACWAMANLRPLWGEENQKKSAKRIFLI